MRSVLLILFIILPGLAHGTPDEAQFGLDPDSVEWKRAELENWFEQRGTKDIAPFVIEGQFRVQVKVTFKERVARGNVKSYVSIPLLGTVAELQTGSGPRPQNGLFDRIERIDFTLNVSDAIDDSTVDSMVKVLQSRVPVLGTDRIFTNVLRFHQSQLSWQDWLREFKGYIAGLLFLVIALVGLYAMMSRLRIQTFVKIGPSGSSSRSESAPLLSSVPMARNKEPEMDQNLVKSMLPQAMSQAELRRLQTAANTLSITECINLIRVDTKLGSLLLSLLPPEKSMRVVNQLPVALQDELTMNVLDFDDKTLPASAAALMDQIKAVRSVSRLSPTQSEQISEYIDHIGPVNEESVYAELIKQKKFDKLRDTVMHSIPMAVVPELNNKILQAAFQKLSFADRAKLILICDSSMGERLCPSDSSDDVEGQIRNEVERLRKIPSAVQEANAAVPKFLAKVRESLGKNPQFQRLATPHIENWLWAVSGGKAGVGKKHGAA